jgi:hypothetical protein
MSGTEWRAFALTHRLRDRMLFVLAKPPLPRSTSSLPSLGKQATSSLLSPHICLIAVSRRRAARRVIKRGSRDGRSANSNLSSVFLSFSVHSVRRSVAWTRSLPTLTTRLLRLDANSPTMANQNYVFKRDGRKERIAFDKVSRRVRPHPFHVDLACKDYCSHHQGSHSLAHTS